MARRKISSQARERLLQAARDEELKKRFACGDRSVLRTFVLTLYTDAVLIKTLAAPTEGEADVIEEGWIAGDGCTVERTAIYQER